MDSKESSTSSHKRPRLEEKQSSESSSFEIPVLQPDASSSDIEEAYQTCQAVSIPKISTSSHQTFTWKDVGSLFESLDKDKESWCVENGGKDTVLPAEFLKAHHNGYSSFLVQKDADILQETLKRLPISTLVESWSHSECIWFFFGVSHQDDDTCLAGRPEHTDSVSHDGTWHYQVSGCKRWYLRPTQEMLQTRPQATSTVIECQQGDVILLNTRLWWHRTELPPQPTPSVSYARDFYKKAPSTDSEDTAPASMTNVDGMYASNDIEENTIIFTEHEMPDCELPHADMAENANCKVVELEDGTSALVSTRLIQSGEFFCVAQEESSDEEEEVDELDFGSEDGES